MHNPLNHLRGTELAALCARAMLEVLDGAYADDVEAFTGLDAERCERIIALREELARRLESGTIVLPNLDGIES